MVALWGFLFTHLEMVKMGGWRDWSLFFVFSPFGPLSVISSRSRSETTIYLKKVPEADSYICLNYVLAILLFLLWSDFGSVRGFIHSILNFVWASTGILFFSSSLSFLLSQCTLLPATAAAYLSLSSSSLLILFTSPFFLHCFLRVNHPLLYLLIPMNNHPLYCGGHSSSSSPFPLHYKWKMYWRFFLPFSLLGVISCEWMNAWMVPTWRGCTLS